MAQEEYNGEQSHSPLNYLTQLLLKLSCQQL